VAVKAETLIQTTLLMAALVAAPQQLAQAAHLARAELATLRRFLRHKVVMAGIAQMLLAEYMALAAVVALLRLDQTQQLMQGPMGVLERHPLFLAVQ
jgi:hypothetical protein